METLNIQQLQQDVKTAPATKQLQNFPPLDQETRSHVDTACTAYHLTRKAQTLRAWACLENGPIRPRRINGRLSWAVADIRALLNGGCVMTAITSMEITYRLPCHPDEPINSIHAGLIQTCELHTENRIAPSAIVSVIIGAGVPADEAVAILEATILDIKASARGSRLKEVFWNLGGMTQEDIAKQAAYKASVSASMKKLFPEIGAAK
jgi:hypothetical protein